MIESAISTAGLGFIAAIAAVFLAAAIEQAGAPREPSEEPQRRGPLAAALALASLITPGVLVAYAYFRTAEAAPALRMLLIASPIIAVVTGSLIGTILGALARDARATLRTTHVFAGFAALALALGVTLPSLDWPAAIGAVTALSH